MTFYGNPEKATKKGATFNDINYFEISMTPDYFQFDIMGLTGL